MFLFTIVFFIPEILLALAFSFYFIYVIYSRVSLQTSWADIGRQLRTLGYFLGEALTQSEKTDFAEIDKRIGKLRESLGLSFNMELRKLDTKDRRSLLFLSFICFVSFLFYCYKIRWFLLENLFLDDKVFFFNYIYVDDIFSNFMKALLAFLCFMYFLICYAVSKYWKFYGFEFGFFVFLIFYTMLFLICSNDFFLFYITLEVQTLALVILGAYQMSEKPSVESALKYFISSAMFSGIFLFVLSIIYVLVGTISFTGINQLTIGSTLGSLFKDEILTFCIIFIFVFIAFKMALVPYHFWSPDFYQGSSLLVTAFIALISKLGLLAILVRLAFYVFVHFYYVTSELMLFFGVGSMLVGALYALFQTDIRRFLAYTSVSNFGYTLLSFSGGFEEGLIYGVFYFVCYIFGTLPFFIGILGLIQVNLDTGKEEDINKLNNSPEFTFPVSIYDLQGLYKTNKFLALGFILLLMNLIGVPPFFFFFAKYFLFDVFMLYQFNLFALVLVLSSLLSAFYYLRLIKIIVLDRSIVRRAYVFPSSLMSFLFYFSVLLTMIVFVEPLLLDPVIRFLQLVLKSF